MDQAIDFLLGMTGRRVIEVVAVLLGVANITLIIRRSIWNYPFGILMVILYSKIFFDAKLYSDAGLQIFFLVMQVYGWWYWLKGRDSSGLVIVERLSTRHLLTYVAIAVVGTAVLGTLVGRTTDAHFPYWDASIAVLSVIAQILLARRQLENWLFWITVDALAIGLYWTKELYPTAALYSVFLVLATLGYFQWRRAWRRGEAIS